MSREIKGFILLLIRYESCWPACKLDLNGIILVIDTKNSKYDNTIDEWVNGFFPGFNIDDMTCFSYSREEETKETKQKVCMHKINLANQFPKLQITEVVNDFNILLPHFNKFVTKILYNMMP
jgi:hypothetical protein